jgi:cytochrome c peroxidase
MAGSLPLGLDLYMPVPEDNPITAEKTTLGRRLFFDRRLSRDRRVACASCHNPRLAFSDGRPVALGAFGRKGTRNAPAIINRGYGTAFFWDGRAASLEQQALEPITNPKEMDLSLEEAERRTGLSRRQIAQALASYLRTILSGDSPFDRYASGERAALSESERRGLELFRGKANCVACHVGPNFTAERFHNTGVAWRNGRLQDAGRFEVTRSASDRGAFKTPTLREVARTGPYMHDGSINTLEEVIEYYNRGGNSNPLLDPELRPLHLTPDERRSLAHFLRALSGRVVEGRI